MVTQAKPHVFTVADYHRMGEAGILDADSRVELIEGEIVDMPPMVDGHRSVVIQLNDLLVRLLHRKAVISPQCSVRLSDISEPEPDFAVLRWRDDAYARKTPLPEDILLLIEVSDTTLAYDRDRKASFYARAGVPEYWIVDVGGRSIIVFREPTEAGYSSVTTIAASQRVSPQAFHELTVSPSDIVL